MHGLVHLGADGLTFGTLDEFSAFDSESFLCKLKRLVRSGREPLEQLFNRVMELRETSLQPKKNTSIVCTMEHCDGQLIDGCLSPQFRKAHFENFVLRTSPGDNCCILKDSRVVIIENISANVAGQRVLIARKFLEMHDLYSVPCQSSNLGIHVVSQPLELQVWPLTHVQNKCVCLPIHSGRIEEFAVFPLRHSSLN